MKHKFMAFLLPVLISNTNLAMEWDSESGNHEIIIEPAAKGQKNKKSTTISKIDKKTLKDVEKQLKKEDFRRRSLGATIEEQEQGKAQVEVHIKQAWGQIHAIGNIRVRYLKWRDVYKELINEDDHQSIIAGFRLLQWARLHLNDDDKGHQTGLISTPVISDNPDQNISEHHSHIGTNTKSLEAREIFIENYNLAVKLEPLENSPDNKIIDLSSNEILTENIKSIKPESSPLLQFFLATRMSSSCLNTGIDSIKKWRANQERKNNKISTLESRKKCICNFLADNGNSPEYDPDQDRDELVNKIVKHFEENGGDDVCQKIPELEIRTVVREWTQAATPKTKNRSMDSAIE
jgi:hypothetical protein